MKLQIPLQKPIVSNPNILSGTPVIEGTRIPASLVFDLLRNGYSIELIKTEYPSLTKPKLKALMKIMAESFSEPAQNSL